ncbi:MAG: hypothetical protein HY645_05435 [Acidobacteria bacterium]|nr:hypothetical protein [Acidobacteriota bacterium]
MLSKPYAVSQNATFRTRTSYEEIAEVTGARLGTVKSRIFRGREMLRQILKPFHPR